MRPTRAATSAGMISQRKSSVRPSSRGIRSIAKVDGKVLPVTTAEYGASKGNNARLTARLDKSKLVENGFTPLPTWQDALGRYLKEIEF